MKGHVPTPNKLAERMVQRLFESKPPTSADRILYPGCGTAPFAAAVERICEAKDWELPKGCGIDLNPKHLNTARNRHLNHVDFSEQDYLASETLELGQFEYIVGNPPYVPIERLTDDEKERYKQGNVTAVGRFDLYILFFERALDQLAPDGRLSFVTPEKFEYVDTAEPLRRLLTGEEYHVKEIEHIDEDAFAGLVTFPCITTVQRSGFGETRVTLRDGTSHLTVLPSEGESWAPTVRGVDINELETGATLKDITVRISPGMATGADALFVAERDEVPEDLAPKWTRPTVSGEELSSKDDPRAGSVFICPYRDDGTLPDDSELDVFGDWAEQHRDQLESRSCVQKNGKKWYAWHETPPMEDLLQPKIVFKDIAKEPKFWAESEGDIVPRHSVYYLVLKDGIPLDEILEYLNGPEARLWMEANCQKAANGFLRLQSRVLQDLPVPAKWA